MGKKGTPASPSTAQIDAVWKYRYTRRGQKVFLHCRIFYTQNAWTSADQQIAVTEILRQYRTTTRTLLEQHNIGFLDTEDVNPLGFSEEIRASIDSQRDDQLKRLRGLIEIRWPSYHNRPQPPPFTFPLICVRAETNAGWRGEFIELNLSGDPIQYNLNGNYTNGPVDVNKGFGLLNLNRPNRTDWATMIHEIGHGAYKDGVLLQHHKLPAPPVPPLDIMCSDIDSAFPPNGVRNGIMSKHVIRIGEWRYCDTQ